MMSFEVEFFLAPFLERGATIGSEQKQKRIQTYVADLTRLVPRLQRLRTSTITTRIEHKEDGLVLRFFLRETKQRDLFNTLACGLQGLAEDAFDREVQEVHIETERLASLLEQAMSPGVSSVRLRADDTLAQQMRVARELVLRRRGMHVLSGHKRPRNCSSALFFAQGTIATISAKISSLSPGQARLREVNFTGEIPQALENVRFHRSVHISRPNFSEADETVMRLMRSMESESRVSMIVLILWDAVTGQPRDMEFRSFCS